jgi:methylaspartate ammonia-lyase
MAEYNEYETFEDDTEDYGTDLVKKLRKQVDQLSKQIKERDSQLEEYQTYSHEAAIGEVLESFGLNPRIAAFIPSDIEADEEAVAEWLNEYGDAFGITAVDESESSEEDPDAQAFEQMSNFEDGDVDPSVGRDIHSLISNATSVEELTNFLKR